MRIPRLSDAAKALSLSSAVQQRLGGKGHSTSVSTEGLVELPGGTPFSLCPVSRPTDLFDIKYVELSKQPVYMYAPVVRQAGPPFGLTDPSLATTTFSPTSTVSCKARARGRQTQPLTPPSIAVRIAKCTAARQASDQAFPSPYLSAMLALSSRKTDAELSAENASLRRDVLALARCYMCGRWLCVFR